MPFIEIDQHFVLFTQCVHVRTFNKGLALSWRQQWSQKTNARIALLYAFRISPNNSAAKHRCIADLLRTSLAMNIGNYVPPPLMAPDWLPLTNHCNVGARARLMVAAKWFALCLAHGKALEL